MLMRIVDMLRRSDGRQRVMPPTQLFNEGWLLRGALDWFATHPTAEHPLAVPTGSRWYSEALLPSQFLPRSRGDGLAESHTHADGVIGQFDIGRSGEGDLSLRPGAQRLVVLEAKLGSSLSPGTRNAPGYDQAARNLACMAHVLSLSSSRPEAMATLGFYVVAPASQIERDVFGRQLAKGSIREKVAKRVAAYDEPDKMNWLGQWFTPTLERAQIGSLSWEDIGAFIAEHDLEAGSSFRAFYSRCLEYNRLAER